MIAGVSLGYAIIDGTTFVLSNDNLSCVGNRVSGVGNGEVTVAIGDVTTCDDAETQPLTIIVRTANNQVHNNFFINYIFLVMPRAAKLLSFQRTSCNPATDPNATGPK